MKLLLCEECNDVIKLDYKVRYCKCRKTGGRYLQDGLKAEYWGEHAIPLGFANSSLVEAVNDQPENGQGRIFTAFVIPKQCPTMRKV
jgi:hypothetical protein